MSARDIVAEALEHPDMVQIPKLVADLMSANFNGYTAAVNAEVEHLREMLADRDAELGAIRIRINELFAGDFMPNQDAIVRAVFYPRKDLIDRLRNKAATDE